MVLEALAFVSIVAFDCPHRVSEIVRDQVNGRLLPAEDVPALTAAPVYVLPDHARLGRMRSAIPETLRSFTAPVVSARWNALFAALTEA